MGRLTADRQALAVAQTAIAGEIHQSLDVHRHFAAQIAFDLVIGVDRLADLQDFLVRQILDAALRPDAELGGDFLGLGAPNAVDVGERDLYALIGRDVDTRDTCHAIFSPAPQEGWRPSYLSA